VRLPPLQGEFWVAGAAPPAPRGAGKILKRPIEVFVPCWSTVGIHGSRRFTLAAFLMWAAT